MRSPFDPAEPTERPAGGDAAVRTYRNPILDRDFPDPALIHASDGYYYAYATQTLHDGQWLNIQVARSSNLIDWKHLGDALPEKPAWARETQDFWAPSVIFDGSTYFMYYSATPDAAREGPDHALAIATSQSPGGPFVDIGRPFLAGKGFHNIDPMAFDCPLTGKHWLYWGSGFEPIKVRELASDRISFAAGTEPIELIWPNGENGSFPRLVEASWVIHHRDYFYLFYSGDNCCGPDAEYGVMVARSKSATGPFETLEQATGIPYSLMLSRGDRWLAPGHNSIVTDRAGQTWIVYHAIDVNRPRQRQEDEINSRRILLIDKIEWRDGWPFVGTPSDQPQAAPVT